MINIEDIKKLREETSVGIADAKKALEESKGDFELAKSWLRKKGLTRSIEKSSREANEGIIGSYVHQTGKIGVIVEINCETDFVARTEDFKSFAHDIAMHIAAYNPIYVNSDKIEKEKLDKIKKEFEEEVKDKPEKIRESIVKGKLDKYFEEVCLINQKFIKNDKITVNELLGEIVAKLGENIKIEKFYRIQIG